MTEEVQQSTVFDSGLQHLGSVYAKALMGAAAKSGDADQVLEQLEGIVTDVLGKVPNMETMLGSPRVSVEAKVSMIEKSFAGKVSPTLLNFLKVLAERGRLECLRAVNASARRIYNDQTGRVEVLIKTAEPLADDLRDAVAAKLSEVLKAEVDVSTEVDAELIGGIVVRVGDTLFDGSVAQQLVRLREEAVQRVAEQLRSGQSDQFSLSE